jgi:hypothetical protein
MSLLELVAKTLEPGEREAVLGDLAESGVAGAQALREVLGLALRRQAALWIDWRPWLALTGIVGMMGPRLTLNAASLARSYDLYLWIIWNYRVVYSATLRETHLTLQHGVPSIAFQSFLLASWAWTSGFVLASIARRAIWVTAIVFSLVLIAGGFWGAAAHQNGSTPAVLILPPLIQAALVLLPCLWGMCRGIATGARPGLLTFLWGAAFAAALALQYWLFWPPPLDWRLRLALFSGNWPAFYAIAVLCRRRWRQIAISN